MQAVFNVQAGPGETLPEVAAFLCVDSGALS